MKKTQNPQPSGKRSLKVYPKYFQRSNQTVEFPQIRLCGKWVQDSGFVCGQEITVVHDRNRIVITIQDESP